jgi:hypothetical protein
MNFAVLLLTNAQLVRNWHAPAEQLDRRQLPDKSN